MLIRLFRLSHSFGSIFYHSIHGCMFYMLLFNFVNYAYLLLCILIVIFVILLLCMFRSLYSVSLCCSVQSLCVTVYCTNATGCQTNCG